MPKSCVQAISARAIVASPTPGAIASATIAVCRASSGSTGCPGGRARGWRLAVLASATMLPSTRETRIAGATVACGAW